MTRFLFVRHGQSVWNALGRWQGQADPPLTDLGRRQARDAAARLPSFDVLAASTLQRAFQTAEEIAAIRASGPIHTDPALMERDAGAFSGLTIDDIRERFPGYLETDRWPDDWEDNDSVLVRVKRAIAAMHEAHHGATIVVISHGGIIYALEGLFDLEHQRISNLGGRWFEQRDGALHLGERIDLLDADAQTVPDHI